MTENQQIKIIKAFNNGKDIDRNNYISTTYSLRYIVNKLRRGIDPRVIADCCEMTKEELELKLNLLGYTIRGNIIKEKEGKSVEKNEISLPTLEEQVKIKEMLKDGKDTPEIIDRMVLTKSSELFKMIARFRQELKEESERLYKVSTFNKVKGHPFSTVYKI